MYLDVAFFFPGLARLEERQHLPAARGDCPRRSRRYLGRTAAHVLQVIRTWPLHDIIFINTLWCIAYKREVGRGLVYCPKLVQIIAKGWELLVGGGVEGMVDSCTPASK